MAISPIFIILPTIYFLPQLIDYTNPDTIFNLRVIFVVVHVTLFAVALYIQWIAKNKSDTKRVVIPPPQPGLMDKFLYVVLCRVVGT
jgi:hypothetical protein